MQEWKHLPFSVLPLLPYLISISFHRLAHDPISVLKRDVYPIVHSFLSVRSKLNSYHSRLVPERRPRPTLFLEREIVDLSTLGSICNPGTVMCLVVPDESPSASLLFLRAFRGLSQNDICPILDITCSSQARGIAPLGQKSGGASRCPFITPAECFYIRTVMYCTA